MAAQARPSHSQMLLSPGDHVLIEATTHFNGQSTVLLKGATATGESYCLAHHVQVQEGRRALMVASIRYLDTFTKQAGRWLFSERRLLVDWVETRPL